ncbi:MAG TPA: hypothetical protein VF212_04260 [Longimicrobiales bacterium]
MSEPSSQKPPERPGEPPRPAAPLPPMVYVREEPAWEYRRLVRNLSKEDAPTDAELNELGRDGWELAGTFTDSPFVYLYFKRLKD